MLVGLDAGRPRHVQRRAVIAGDLAQVEAAGGAEAERLGHGQRPVRELRRGRHQLELASARASARSAISASSAATPPPRW